MNLDELQTVRDRERQTDKLQQLRASFYADAGEFIQQLHAERDRAAERADDPFDAPEVSQLTDEIQTAEQTVEAIYEKRVGKLVKAASFAAADLPAEVDGMTAEEEELFETLVGDIKANREHVLSVLAGDDTSAAETDETTQAEEPTVDAAAPTEQTATRAGDSVAGPVGGAERTVESKSEPAEGHTPPPPGIDDESPDPNETDEQSADFTAAAMGGGDGSTADREVRNDGGSQSTTRDRSANQPDSEPSQPVRDGDEQASRKGEQNDMGGGVDRETVRITADVGTFVGTDDREYDLGKNDIVQLPATNVQPLLKRDVAEQLDF